MAENVAPDEKFIAEEESLPTRRVRRLTDKAQQTYEERVDKEYRKLEKKWGDVKTEIEKVDSCTTIEELKLLQKTICLLYGEYRLIARNLLSYLDDTNTEESIEKRKQLEFVFMGCNSVYDSAYVQIDLKMKNIQYETMSNTSRQSQSSVKSSRSLQAKVRAKTALARIGVLEREKELKKKQIDIETELKLLEEQKVCEEANIEIDLYEGSDRSQDVDETSSSKSQKDIISEHSVVESKSERITDYVNSLPDETVRSVHVHQLNPEAREFVYDRTDRNVTSELSKFLLRKDLMFSRLTRFDDKPENFAVWKSTFKSVIEELGVCEREELDLLVKWLGPDSVKHAVSARASSSTNAANGLQRLWERLNERYGAAEMVDASLRMKLEKFSRLTAKDNSKLFELSDIVEEILSHMDNSEYRDLLSYYNTSIGIIPIINKLPLYLQERWTTRASNYKREFKVSYPPFSFLAKFIREISIMKNDPGFWYSTQKPDQTERLSYNDRKPKTKMSSLKTLVAATENKSVEGNMCQLHNVNGHTLNTCKTFRSKPISVRKKFVKDKNLCFKCIESSSHRASNCSKEVSCDICKSMHATGLHVNYVASNSNGGEKADTSHSCSNTNNKDKINTSCAQVCGSTISGKSCAKVVAVYVYAKNNPENKVKMYTLIDDQSNKSLVKPEFFEQFDGKFNQVVYSLASCAGKIETCGRRATEFMIESLDGQTVHELPSLTECLQIPEIKDEIPTPDAARAFPHLKEIAQYIPEVDEKIPILMLLGRDVPEVHHVLDQRLGYKGEPFAQRLSLGWVLIGETCLGQVHRPSTVIVNKIYVHHNGRQSIFPPCENQMSLKDRPNIDAGLAQDVFIRTPDDNKIGSSEEDREFMDIMSDQFVKTESGNWSAPLPFRKDRPALINNRDQALRRAHVLCSSLKKNCEKRKHFVEFMGRMFENGHAEIAPPVPAVEECWYLPIFGVYHTKKKDHIRVVFDSSAQCQGLSLNSVLLQGPDLTNSLLGVLMRFRQKPVAVIADIQQMFFQFRVHKTDRNFLRFFWFRNNNPDQDLVEYRMCVHVFGNTPSPAIATYGLRKSVADADNTCDPDVREFVEKDFYVDDGLASFRDAETAIDVVKRTQEALFKGGNLRLHKIASNDREVLNAFQKEDLSTDLKDVAIGEESLPCQRSLGLSWNLGRDSFTFQVSTEEKAFTRRGVLSTVNSLYDPLGFIAPVIIQGKIIMRDLIEETIDWDQPLSQSSELAWQTWRDSLLVLDQLEVPRQYLPRTTASHSHEIHIFSDASEKAISAVAYTRSTDHDTNSQLGFVLGKSKVAPKTGHTIPRLELCAAVMAVEIGEIVSEHLGVDMKSMTFYTDSRVVLGYLNNKVRRFYIYVQNRVSRILKSTTREQWFYVATEENPADQGTRPIHPSGLLESTCKWLQGPDFLKANKFVPTSEQHDLLTPEEDKEVRPTVQCLKTVAKNCRGLDLCKFDTIGKWSHLVKVIARLKLKARQFKFRHCVSKPDNTDILKETETLIIREAQGETFKREIECLETACQLPKNSSIRQLNPWIDEHGLLRVGGRLKHTQELSTDEKYPVILHKRHYVGRLIAVHYHDKVYHQGYHFTEGAIRTAGFWLIGCKRLVRSIISKCVKCRKLRGKTVSQVMSDLPEDRVTAGAPFSTVGVDVFGPWNVVARRTRGGVANSKRWAVLYTCLTSRAIHIEVIEELSTSSFINATRRFTSIRGPVKSYRSDRGTNFVGATDLLHIKAINVEDGPVKSFLDENNAVWRFNPPFSSHMGGVWERLIGVVRRILDSMLSEHSGKLTHEVLSTLMAEVCLIVNSRPLVQVSVDHDNPAVLSPNMLLTQKPSEECDTMSNISVKEMYNAQWKRVQCLSNMFWKRWRSEYLGTLQERRKWVSTHRDLCVGDVVLVVEDDSPRNAWPMGIVTEVYPSKDGHVRKVSVRIRRKGESQSRTYTRPVTKLVTLVECEDKCV